ncbi:MAG: tRNA (adenosine(37)-N6)-dimethylallyltransferase MiaA [Pusillimonas sp.]|nr:tRNA (adenosine(37)-N6)-dimethylallyltransferase MiaA [Pusillimonas sp.]MBC43367.1 tRNA (adenosine(37)-N6)-dimethylallyltransferase MiaA [Pusillimonas sp.]HCP78078.1 tRNA (adenosine(37)-N6)-dimethylallyltransferase MiaA [Pusillimonas sp.]|tara:strand:+ start:201 stop:1142 length:942 start_codon:yes stop_codon:yes gene_type:complete
MSHHRFVICLAGPTASGKSAATLALARHWPIEIINVDSATIYRQMDIGTAKPSPQEQHSVPHHLLDIRDPSESYSAADFCSDALKLIDEIHSRNRLALLCGGTMMYYKALREGLNNLPAANPAIRQALENEAAALGWPAMHGQLQHVDPPTAQRLAPNDSQRIQRALEIYRITGRPMSQWLADQPPVQKAPWNYVTISLEPSDRSVLHDRIAQRYQAMIEAGLVAEVQALFNRGDLNESMPSIRCVGYRQIWACLKGEVDLPTAIEQAIAATRQLAKRQLTWLRAQPERHIIDCLSRDVADNILDIVPQYWKK